MTGGEEDRGGNAQKIPCAGCWFNAIITQLKFCSSYEYFTTGELGYVRLNGTRKIGPSYAKSVVYI